MARLYVTQVIWRVRLMSWLAIRTLLQLANGNAISLPIHQFEGVLWVAGNGFGASKNTGRSHDGVFVT